MGVLTARVNAIVAAGAPMSDRRKVALAAFIPAALAVSDGVLVHLPSAASVDRHP